MFRILVFSLFAEANPSHSAAPLLRTNIASTLLLQLFQLCHEVVQLERLKQGGGVSLDDVVRTRPTLIGLATCSEGAIGVREPHVLPTPHARSESTHRSWKPRASVFVPPALPHPHCMPSRVASPALTPSSPLPSYPSHLPDVPAITKCVVNHVPASLARQMHNSDNLAAYHASTRSVRNNSPMRLLPHTRRSPNQPPSPIPVHR